MSDSIAAIELVKLWLSDNATHVNALTDGDWKANVVSLYREALEVIRDGGSSK